MQLQSKILAQLVAAVVVEVEPTSTPPNIKVRIRTTVVVVAEGARATTQASAVMAGQAAALAATMVELMVILRAALVVRFLAAMAAPFR